jgi:hypothetical protein
MTRTRLAIFLSAIVLSISLAAAESPSDEHEQREYGVRNSSTISVRVGGAVRYAGIYHIKPETTVPELMKPSCMDALFDWKVQSVAFR